MKANAERRPAGPNAGRPGVRRPWATLLCAISLAVPSVAGCAGREPARPPTPELPGFLQPAWLRTGFLDIDFTARRWDAGPAPRTSHIRSELTVGDGGRVVAMRTAQSTGGVVTSTTTWHDGSTVDSAETPRCMPATSEATVPATVGDLLASMFGPVDSATTTGWSIDGATASRPGSEAGVVERTQLAPLPRRTPRETVSATGAVVNELTGIRIRHLGGPAPTGLPSCGDPAPAD